MSHSQFHCTGRVYLDMHGLIFETSICYWQDQPGSRAPRVRESGARGSLTGGRPLAPVASDFPARSPPPLGGPAGPLPRGRGRRGDRGAAARGRTAGREGQAPGRNPSTLFPPAFPGRGGPPQLGGGGPRSTGKDGGEGRAGAGPEPERPLPTRFPREGRKHPPAQRALEKTVSWRRGEWRGKAGTPKHAQGGSPSQACRLSPGISACADHWEGGLPGPLRVTGAPTRSSLPLRGAGGRASLPTQRGHTGWGGSRFA